MSEFSTKEIKRIIDRMVKPCFYENCVNCVKDNDVCPDYKLVEKIMNLVTNCTNEQEKADNKLIIELPCKVGDKVYHFDFVHGVIEDEVVAFVIVVENGEQNIQVKTKKLATLFVKYFNRGWFLSREEAEKRFEELKG